MNKDERGKAIGRRKHNKGLPGIAGRKKYEDPALISKPVTVYIPQYIIDGVGGIKTARDIAKNAIQTDYNKK